MISSKYLPIISIILVSVTLILCGFAMANHTLFTQSGYSLEYPEKLFNTDKLLDINIEMDSDSWREMLDNAMQEEYYKCNVTINGKTFYSVGIRPKGNTSLSSIAMDPDNDRYSFKLEFDKYIDGQTCYGLDKLVLNNNYADTTNMKEALIYDMFNFLDADASLYNYAKISVNDEYFGAYLALEAVEDGFMLRNYGTHKGYLYKPEGMDHGGGEKDKNNNGNKGMQMPPNPPENMPTPPKDMGQMPDFNPDEAQRNGKEFHGGGHGGGPGGMGGGNGANLIYTDDNLDSYSTIWEGEVNSSSKADHMRVITALKNIGEGKNIETYMDVDNILKYMAVHNFAVNDDSLSGGMAHNYYLYETDGMLNIIPWDYNLSFGAMHSADASQVINKGIDDSYSSTTFFNCILQNEEYKAKYHEYYQKLVNEYFDGGEFQKTYDRIRTSIDKLVETDPNAMYTYEQYTNGADMLYDTLLLRAKSVKGQLDGTIPSTTEAQREAPSSLVDSSAIDISIMGEFMGGGPKR